MIEKLRIALMKSSLSNEEIEHIIFLLFCCGDSNHEPIPDDLVNAGYISIEENRCILTAKGRVYRDSLVQKLAQFYITSEIIFRQYFDNELKILQHDLKMLRQQWREARDKRLQYKRTLMKQGKDKVTIKKDKQYRQLLKEQEKLRTTMRHKEKEYNKKLSACIKRLGIIIK